MSDTCVPLQPPTFDAEVRKGLWPPAMRRGSRNGALTWVHRLLDRATDRLAGLADAVSADVGLKAAEALALEASRGASPHWGKHRHKATA
jgi:hypothetical protein